MLTMLDICLGVATYKLGRKEVPQIRVSLFNELVMLS